MSEDPGYRAAVRAWAIEHHVPETVMGRWVELAEADALAILAVARELHLRTGQLLSAFDTLGEIGVREADSAAGILARRELRAIIAGGGSRPERASAFMAKLRELRYPRLAHTRTKLKAAVAAMRLPPGLTVVLPKDLSSDEVVIRVTVRSAAELGKLLDVLGERKEEIKALVEALGGLGEF